MCLNLDTESVDVEPGIGGMVDPGGFFTARGSATPSNACVVQGAIVFREN